ncbi:Helicase associated domain protein [Streptomyces malaysiensis]|uniref:Helicase associated domain protein n=1 Tax=Streptomyces malaysiensis TaxID=92644 RepID=UPI00202E5DF6|nr:Helicase associated domain protein [Streptomyces malaysiensis]
MTDTPAHSTRDEGARVAAYAPPTTRDGWQQFVATPPLQPHPAADEDWSLEERLDYHSRFVVLTTPAMERISLSLRRLMLLNRRQQGTARRGLIVSGPPTTGKTTTLLEMGRTFELAEQRRHPGRTDRLPVVFLAVPPASTPKMLVSEFARFLGIPIAARMNQAQITDAVCHLLCLLETKLVLVDDVHLLDTRTRSGAETSDQMKHLGERIPATFVYAGVDVEASPLLTGPRGAQSAPNSKPARPENTSRAHAAATRDPDEVEAAVTKAISRLHTQPPQREQRASSPQDLPLGAVRVAPLHGETTLSYMSRVASRYRLTAKELIGALVDVGRRPNLFTVQPDGEVVFNTEARAVVAAFCRMPEERLHRALPAWSRDVPSSRLGSGPAAWVRTAATIPPTGPGCRACTARATQGRDTARRYLPPHARVCVKHQCWMVEAPVVDGATAGPGQLDLRHVPQIAAAQRRHARLLRRCPHAAEAFTTAQAILASWWDEPWPEETIWPDRLRLMAAGHGLARRTAARDAVTYPEAVTLAAALADTGVQQRLLDEAGRHQPHSLADVPHLVGELARRLERPWIADRLTVVTTGPLNAWVRACVRSQAGHEPKTRSMWRLSPPHRPTPVSQFLAESSDRGGTPVQPEPAPLPDSAEDAAQGFARGLRHARAYAAEHGHLCAPNTVRVDGFAVGLWLANQRTAGPELAPERTAALDALDPWWNPPGTCGGSASTTAPKHWHRPDSRSPPNADSPAPPKISAPGSTSTTPPTAASTPDSNDSSPTSTSRRNERVARRPGAGISKQPGAPPWTTPAPTETNTATCAPPPPRARTASPSANGCTASEYAHGAANSTPHSTRH